MQRVILKDILDRLRLENSLNLSPETELKGLTNIWQDVTEGSVYVAIEGTKHDGHDFIEAAIKNGAVLIVASNPEKVKNTPALIVKNTRQALSNLAALFYGEPSKKISLVGITGTNGKTTTNWMVYNMMLQSGADAARLGTLGLEYQVSNQKISREGNLTTPDAVSIQKDLWQSVQAGVSAAVMEVSSHALHQYRADDLHFDNVIYTNLTRDHLDYHSDMESYFEAKAEILNLLKKSIKNKKSAIINLDCNYGSKMLERAKQIGVEAVTFGKSEAADFRINGFVQDLTGSTLDLNFRGKAYTLKSKFIGYHNTENAVAAIASMEALGHQIEDVLDMFARIPQVPGRLESVGNSEVGIFVDYAHTPDALENVIKSLVPLAKGNLWIVFGCGGDRDRGKRPLMAEIAAKYSDKVVVTSDNPRTEDPHAIIKDILSGGVKAAIIEADRRKAIEKTIKNTNSGDIVLIAGKGHENYQILGTEKVHFSDVEEVARVLKV